MKKEIMLALMGALFAVSARAELIRTGLVTVFAENPDASFAWYTEKLGLKGEAKQFDGQLWRFVYTKWEPEQRLYIRKGRPAKGEYILGFQTDNLDRIASEMKRKGVEFLGVPAHGEGAKRVSYPWGTAVKYPWGIEADFKDPDGQIIAVTEVP